MRTINRLLFSLPVVLLVLAPRLYCRPGNNANFSCAGQTNSTGKTVRFKPDEMKKRAIHKVDIDPAIMGRLDFSSTFVLEVVAAPDGHVACTRTLFGFAPASAEVDKAVRQWRFKQLNIEGKPVATTGILEFRLCNISCGKDMSMSLLD